MTAPNANEKAAINQQINPDSASRDVIAIVSLASTWAAPDPAATRCMTTVKELNLQERILQGQRRSQFITEIRLAIAANAPR